MAFNPSDGVIDTPGTVNEIPEYDEGKYVEYKDHLIYSENYDENHTEETWYDKLRHEMVAFANAEGGMMVFGVSDDSEEGACGCNEYDEHGNEINFTERINELASDIKPSISVETNVEYLSDFDSNASKCEGDVIVFTYIPKADRKPVMGKKGAVYYRFNNEKSLLGYDEIKAMFVAHDREQVAIKKLELEIHRFRDIKESEFSENSSSQPKFNLLNIDSIDKLLKECTQIYGYNNSTNNQLVFDILSTIDEINILKSEHQDRIKEFNKNNLKTTNFSQYDSKESINEDINYTLHSKLVTLENKLEQLCETCGLQPPNEKN